ncbi:MAG: HD domain-containing protein [Deltaproteobacteria bacterium]|nr:MAG: HD domain-containing protein [Deltaproteobacteria bacterium]
MTLEALLESLTLKSLPREGWVRRGIDPLESVAGHSYGVALLTACLLPAELDQARALRFAILHDLPEVRTGDLTPHDAVAPSQKHAMERQAMEELSADLPRGGELYADWIAYEAQACPESRFVKQLDRLDMALQAVLYARSQGVDTSEFVRSAMTCIDHPSLRPLVERALIEVERTQEPPSQPDIRKPEPSKRKP